MLNVSSRTLARWSDSGILPAPVRVGAGELRHYYRSDIDALLRKGQTDA